MKHKIAPLAAVAALLIVAGWGLVTALTGPGGPLENPDDRYLRQTRAALAVDQAQADLDAYRAALARQEAQAAALLPVQTAQAVTLTVVQTLALAALVAAVPLGLALAALVALDAYRQRRTPLIRVRPDGTLPVSRPALLAGDYYALQAGGLEGLHRARYRAARTHALPPQTFSPHYSGYSGRPALPALSGPADADEADAPPPLAAPVPVPTLGASIQAGLFRTPDRYLLAHALDGAPIWAEPGAARSLLAGGQGRSGKSTALAGQALQEIVVPAPGLHEPPVFILLDPHYNKPSSLTKRLAGLGPRIHLVAHTPADVLRACTYYEREAKRRISTGRAPYRLVLLGDEISLMYEDGAGYEDVRPALNSAFLHANIHYGAVQAPALAGVHLLPAAAFGGKATIRRSFHARAAFRLDAADGQMLGLAPGLARELITLAAGQCMLMAPGLGVQRAIAPDVEADAPALALDYSAGQFAGRTYHPVAAPLGNGPAPDAAPVNSPAAATVPAPVALADAGTVDSADAGLVLSLFYDQAVDIAAIMRRLYPDLSAKGPTMNEYQQKLRAINAVIRAQRPAPAAESLS